MSLLVRQALTGAFLAADFGIDVVQQNGIYSTYGSGSYTTTKGTYTPTPERPFCKLSFFDSGTDAATLKNWDEEIGTFQVILYYPEKKGPVPADTMAKAITDYLPLYSKHSYQTQCVEMVNGRSINEGASEDGWYKLRLRLPYRAFTPR